MNHSSWHTLPSLAEKEDYFSNFLSTLCQLVPNVELGGLFWLSNNQQWQILAKYPELSSDVSPLVTISEQVLTDGCGLVQGFESEVSNHLIGFPVEVEGKIQLVIALAVDAGSEEALQNVMGQIEWSLAQLDRYFFSQQLKQLQTQSQTSVQANQILGQVLSQSTFEEACISLVENLASHTQSERVSIGQFEGAKSHILSMSNTLDFSQKLALVEQLKSAQLESQMQLSNLSFPVGESNDAMKAQIIRAHQKLAESHGHNAVLTVLVFDYQKDKAMFAVTFERNGQNPFNEEVQESLNHIVSLSGAALLDKWHAEASVWQRFKHGFVQQFEKLFGQGHTVRKIFVLLFLTLTLLFSLLTGEYRLAADAKIESQQQYLVTMPFDGYLKTSHVKAGDQVTEQQVLASLDARSHRLELLKAQGKRQQLITEFASLQAEQDRAGMAVLKPQIQQVEADIALAELYIQRASIQAPMTGLVIEGDLTKRIGDAVKAGETLFVIAKTEGYRVWIRTPESRLLDVQVGQTGRLVLQSLPHQSFNFEVMRLTPMQQVADGQNFFLTEAKLLTTHLPQLRPGMQGVAKIYIDDRNLFGIWIRDSYEWFRLTLWRWFGD